MATFKNYEIYSPYYFSYVPGYKAVLRGGTSISNHMLGRAIWDRLLECIFENFETA